MELKEKIKAYHNKMWKKYKQYIPVFSGACSMEKIWNRGNGRLVIWQINTESKKILINKTLYRISDGRHLKEMIAEIPELKGFEILGYQYGYPDYYFHPFHSAYREPTYEKMTL